MIKSDWQGQRNILTCSFERSQQCYLVLVVIIITQFQSGSPKLSLREFKSSPGLVQGL